MIPCKIILTAAVWTQALNNLWEENMKTTNCTFNVFDDNYIVYSTAVIEDRLWSKSYSHIGNLSTLLDMLQPWAYKVDLWRCAMLWAFGGIYFDAETSLSIPPDKIFKLSAPNLQIFQDRTSEKCLYNGAMAADKGSRALVKIIARISKNVNKRSYGHEDSRNEPWLGITGPCTVAKALQYDTEVIVPGRFDGQTAYSTTNNKCFSVNGNLKRSDVNGKDGTESSHYGWHWANKRVYKHSGITDGH